jgi:hypothetical protein
MEAEEVIQARTDLVLPLLNENNPVNIWQQSPSAWVVNVKHLYPGCQEYVINL